MKLKQLEILSLLRGEEVQSLIILEEHTMAISIDITKDLRYREGTKKGIEQGIEKGIEQGQQLNATKVVTRLLQTGSFTNAQIAEFADVEEAFVEQVQQQLIS